MPRPPPPQKREILHSYFVCGVLGGGEGGGGAKDNKMRTINTKLTSNGDESLIFLIRSTYNYPADPPPRPPRDESKEQTLRRGSWGGVRLGVNVAAIYKRRTNIRTFTFGAPYCWQMKKKKKNSMLLLYKA